MTPEDNKVLAAPTFEDNELSSKMGRAPTRAGLFGAAGGGSGHRKTGRPVNEG